MNVWPLPAGRQHWRLPGILTVLALVACSGPPPQIAEFSGATMGTHYSVKLTPPPDAAMREELQQQIEQRLAQINAQMSTYIADSALSRFNHGRTTDWHEVPRDLVALVTQANAISEQTDGAYDVTIGPLVDLWGFGSVGRRDTPPDDAAIADRLRQVGYRNLDVRESPPALRKRIAELQVDLSSIAKGWAVDQLADLLDAAGQRNFLVEIGGDLRARGTKTGGQPWRIAVERPNNRARIVQREFEARNVAVATSGDYRNYFEHGGAHYSHTLDPKSGRPVRHQLASVSVFADTCATADAWATALLALGDKAGPATATRLGIRALFIIRDGDGLRELISPSLRAARLMAVDHDTP